MTTRGPGDSSGANRQRLTIDRRCESRADAEGVLRSDFGPVVDFSMHGVRLLTRFRWAEGAIRRVSISSADRTLIIDAKCVWCRQEGLHDHLVGLSFDRVTEAQAGVIQGLIGDSGTTMV